MYKCAENELGGAGSGRYRAAAKAKGLSLETFMVSVADTVHIVAGGILVVGMARLQEPDGV